VRFTGASIGAYLGLVPGEHSSGGSRHQLPITKTGTSHVRRRLHSTLGYRTPLEALTNHRAAATAAA
jgi:transposase